MNNSPHNRTSHISIAELQPVRESKKDVSNANDSDEETEI